MIDLLQCCALVPYTVTLIANFGQRRGLELDQVHHFLGESARSPPARRGEFDFDIVKIVFPFPVLIQFRSQARSNLVEIHETERITLPHRQPLIAPVICRTRDDDPLHLVQYLSALLERAMVEIGGQVPSKTPPLRRCHIIQFEMAVRRAAGKRRCW